MTQKVKVIKPAQEAVQQQSLAEQRLMSRILKGRDEACKSVEKMYDYLNLVRRAQFQISGFKAEEELSHIRIHSTARNKLIKGFCNHRKIDEYMARMAFAGAEIEVCRVMI